MYEQMTYESILKRVLARVDSGIDTRQGSIIYDAIAPCCMELSMMYIELDRVLDESFADTASREYLIKRARERGLAPREASAAEIQASMDIEVNEGARFNLDELNYTVIYYYGRLGDEHRYRLKCESTGIAGNRLGPLTAIESIPGLSYAQATKILIYGSDEEDTEGFRKRYIDSLDTLSFGGNVAEYKARVMAIDGVGGVKVYTANDLLVGGAVRLVVQSSNFKKISGTLVDEIQELIDPAAQSGEGLGLAPIGHNVSVVSVSELTVLVKVAITLTGEVEKSVVLENARLRVEEYFAELNQNWMNTKNIIIKRSTIGYILSELEGVSDVDNVMLNGSANNITLDGSYIARLGGLNG